MSPSPAPGRPAPSLRRNASWAFAGNAVYVGSQWLVLVALARLGTPAAVGRFALGLAICAPVMLLGNLQLRSVLATDARGEHAWADYLGLRLVTTAAALAVIGGIAGLGYRGDTALVILLVGLAKAVEAASDLCYGWFQKRERMDLMARSLMLRGPLALGALVAGMAVTGDEAWAVAGMAGAWSAILAIHDVPAVAALLGARDPGAGRAPRFDRRTLRGLVRLALPLGFTTLFLSLSHNIPRYFIEHHLGEARLGVFAALAYVVVAGEIVIRALGQTATPRLAQHWAAGERAAFDRLLYRLLGLGGALGLAGVGLAAVAGEPVLELLFGAPYAAEAGVLTWIMAAAALTYLGSLLGYGVAATRAFRRFTAPYAGVPVVALVAAAVLIPDHDLHGAAWTLCAIAAATCVAPLSILFSLGRRR